MVSDANKAVVRRFVDTVYNRKNRSAWHRFVAPKARPHFEQALVSWWNVFDAFPDSSLSIETLRASNDLVVCSGQWQGTHTGKFEGLAPTGKRVTVSKVLTFRVAESRLVESWQQWDTWRLARQIRASMQPARQQEPVLNIREIQGNVLAGFGTCHQTFLFLEMVDVDVAKAWLRQQVPRLTSVEAVLKKRKVGEAGKSSQQNGRSHSVEMVWVNLAFTFEGLRKLSAEAEQLSDRAFKEGMHRRSKLLGDPGDETDPGHPSQWVFGGPDAVPDVCILLASDLQPRLLAEVGRLQASLAPGLRLMYQQDAAQLPEPLARHEHFGFRDPISQPGVRGRFSEAPTDFFTPRENPADPDQGKPGQNLVWPGEFVFGYPGQNAMDKVEPCSMAEAGPAWGRNGSLLVIRRLEQHVDVFQRFLEETAEHLSREYAALTDLTADKLAAKFVGRWRSGVPLVLAPDADHPEIAHDEQVINHFGYVQSATKATSSNGHHAPASGDVLGLVCPQAAHIRKAYPRDHATSAISQASIETHRLIRRGIPYGAPYPAPGERGLMFLAYQTSIERQFEFVTRAWLNNPHLRGGDEGHDPIAGQRSRSRNNQHRLFKLPVQDADGTIRQISIDLPASWVTPTGGGYFFVPAVSALRYLVEA